ncbi:MAG TPA: HDOD domain-containing protein, partial [Burkholderiaceae bacterium]
MSAVLKANPHPGEFRNKRDALMAKLKTDEGLFALGAAVSRVVQLASSDDEAAQSLAYYVLSDVALTQKILRLSNTVTYRRVANTPVTTISRAIFLLGFDTVKTSALAMLLVDSLANHRHAQTIKTELAHALRASLVGRELARRSHHQGAEEASIAALFKNIGRLLVASHDHDSLAEIESLMSSGEFNVNQASSQVLGCSYDTLAESVLAEWNIPASIIAALPAVPNTPQRPAANRQEWMRQVASFSTEAARLITRTDSQVDNDSAKLLTRFGTALNLDPDKMRELFAAVREEMRALSENLHLEEFGVAEGGGKSGLPDVLQMLTMGAETKTAGCHPSGKPVNAHELLLAGVQDVMQMRASGRCKINDLILVVLETLYRSMGFRFATVCLKDTKTGQFRARAALGEQHVARQARFVFPMEPDRGIFHLAMENDADLMISDASSE